MTERAALPLKQHPNENHDKNRKSELIGPGRESMRSIRLAMSERSPRSAWRAASVGLLALTGLGTVQADPSYSYSRTSSFTYQANGLIESETVEPDQPNLCVKTTYTYGDAYGNKTATTTANCAGASTTAQFASRGASVAYATQTVTVGGVSVLVPAGTFATGAANALSQAEARTYDPRFGGVTRLVGPNGEAVATNWTLDDFGRKVLETRADGTSTAVYYCWLKVYNAATGAMEAATSTSAPSNSPGCHNGSAPSIVAPIEGEAPADAVRYEYTVALKGGTAISGFARVFYDRAGRKIRSVAQGFDGAAQPGGARLIAQDVDYNKYGVAVISTQPYFLNLTSSTTSGSVAYGLSKTEYDALGRATAVYSVDTSVTDQQSGGNAGSVVLPASRGGSRQMAKSSVSYDGLTTVSTDDQGHTRTEEKNLDGQVIRTKDAMGAQVVHQYDAFGNLVITKDPLGNRITVDYDVRGRKVAMNDPDAGVVAYCYDALGQLKAQQTSAMRGGHAPGGCPAVDASTTATAVAAWTTMAYDVLGRMTSRAEPEYAASWSYDGCAMGKGKLCQSSTSHGVTRKIAYDALGRVEKQRTDIAGDLSAATAVSYDANGRLLTQTYPTGVKLQYSYTTQGFLNAVSLLTPVSVGGASVSAKPLWSAGTFNAWGKAEQSSYGNGINNRANFLPDTGRLAGLTAGGGTTNAVVNQGYKWDSIGLLTRRVDALGDGSGVTALDTFTYDALGRLTQYDVSGGGAAGTSIRSVTLQYNALGMLLSKSDVGNYVYPTQGVANGRPHAVLGVQNQGQNFGYDLNGNATSATGGKWRSVAYTSFNMADVITGAGPQSSWKYDENHQRIKETKSNRVTWYLHPDNAGGLGFEREVASNGTQSNRHYISAGGQSIAVLVTNGALPALDAAAMAPPDPGAVAALKLEYWHKDQLGSLIATSDHAGNVTARYAYDPFGKRRYTNTAYDPYGNLVVDWTTDGSAGTDRGFTGHEHLDDMGIVHMNGRLYDPTLGRMMQPDPFVQEMLNLQNYDRYGYCYNSPLICTDPTGYSFLSKVWKKFKPIIIAVVVAWVAPELLGYLSNYSANFVVMVGSGANATLQLTTLGSAIAGFTAGAISSGNLKGALQGGFTAGMFTAAGDLITQSGGFAGSSAGGWGESSWQAVAVHGVVGCVTSVSGGGKCGPGMLSAAFSQSAIDYKNQFADAMGSRLAAGTIASAVVGGTASVLGGGKFANGAETAAFGYLFNALQHKLEGRTVVVSGTVSCRGVTDDVCNLAIAQIKNLAISLPDGSGVVVNVHRYGESFWDYLSLGPDLVLFSADPQGASLSGNNGNCAYGGGSCTISRDRFNTSTVTHEVGHHLGLVAHNPDERSVMYEYATKNRGTSLIKQDVQTLIKLQGK
jgi:RHS repeat-associated protein